MWVATRESKPLVLVWIIEFRGVETFAYSIKHSIHIFWIVESALLHDKIDYICQEGWSYDRYSFWVTLCGSSNQDREVTKPLLFPWRHAFFYLREVRRFWEIRATVAENKSQLICVETEWGLQHRYDAGLSYVAWAKMLDLRWWPK